MYDNDKNPATFFALILILVLIFILMGDGWILGAAATTKDYQDKIFQERIREHACVVQTIHHTDYEEKGATCIQPDGKVYSK